MVMKKNRSIYDLIETYWDVKTLQRKKKIYSNYDLIETYWDVKC